MLYDTKRANVHHCLSALVRAEGNKAQAFGMLRAENPILVKAAVPGGEAGDMAGSFDHIMAGEWFLSLEHGQLGVFDTIKAYTRRARFNTPLFVGGALQVGVVNESASIPAVRYLVDSAGLAPVKVGAIVVMTKESLATPEGVADLEAELRQGVMLGCDEKLLSLVATDAGYTKAAGGTPLADLADLLANVNQSGFGNLFFVCSPAVANFLSLLQTTGSDLLFPGMGPKGGELLNVPALVSAAAGENLYLIDPSGICTGAEDILIRTTTQAMVEMDSAPAMDSQAPTGPSGAIISLFQTESIGVLGIRSFAAKLMRASAVAYLSGVNDGWSIILPTEESS